MAKKSGLGKGLDSLIAPAKGTEKREKSERPDQSIPISLVFPNRTQPRKTFDKEALAELAESIKIHGIIQPLILRETNGGYEIIAGERRFRAAQIAGLKEVPAIVRKYTEKERSEIALIENIQREDLNPMEEAMAYDKLIKDFGLKQEELAKRVSKSRAAIANHLRLLNLSQKVQKMVAEGKLSEGHARALLAINSKTQQEKAAEYIASRKLSVRETETYVRKINGAKKTSTKKKDDPDAKIYASLESDLKRYLGTKVAIKKETNEKGKIVIEYYSLDELDRLTEIFRNSGEA